ncbi:MAG: EutN/CcmL family microcompartment protein [Candidatus Caldatribacteriota bacterium]|nr:EutN/CcmL family microcompartment protein [Candidatus Caldatribacteriota bacterium]
MIFGKIAGTVVSAQIDDGMKGRKCLLVQICNYKAEEENNYLVALDLVGAGIGEIAIISQGSSSRQTETTYKKAVDAVIVGIVDMVEKGNKMTYKK